ncbi:hypothetical protein [Nitratiruptor tergarcus]|uniref:hypothetical protein n=1 Tax=Nitratiruptor tergarcus TaxID=269259 RepID=UPI0018D3A8C3|nr:hypothetical protein [Nitratiruptor tergarcus]
MRERASLAVIDQEDLIQDLALCIFVSLRSHHCKQKMVPKIRKGGYIPFFITERKRSEQALIAMVCRLCKRSFNKKDRAFGKRAWN